MIEYVDAHTHLADEAFDEDRDKVFWRLTQMPLKYVNLIGDTASSLQKCLDLKERYPFIDVSCGLHPASLLDYSDEDKSLYYDMAYDPRIICIGEIGLDYHWTPETKELQKAEFIRQIELANEVKKPIMIHSRDALQDTYDIVKKHRPQYGCILHCYSGSYEMAVEFVKLGCMISLGGPVTFKNAKEPKKVAELIGVEHLLTETDSPYLAPTPYRGKRNESSYVSLIATEIANLKKINLDEFTQQIITNYQRVFKK